MLCNGTPDVHEFGFKGCDCAVRSFCVKRLLQKSQGGPGRPSPSRFRVKTKLRQFHLFLFLLQPTFQHYISNFNLYIVVGELHAIQATTLIDLLTMDPKISWAMSMENIVLKPNQQYSMGDVFNFTLIYFPNTSQHRSVTWDSHCCL